MNRHGHKGKVDRTHKQILDGLRKAGVVAYSTAMVGEGFPDIIACRGGATYLLEVKVGKAKLTPDEVRWKETWPGQYAIVRNIEDALRVVLLTARQPSLDRLTIAKLNIMDELGATDD